MWDQVVFLNKEDALKKKDICMSCEFLFKKYICSKCGCILPLKIQLTESTCPVGKW